MPGLKNPKRWPLLDQAIRLLTKETQFNSVDRLASDIAAARAGLLHDRALLVGISGIDGSGKGFITARLDQHLRDLGWRVAVVGADDWLNFSEVSINADEPAEYFYESALRLEEMFERLVIPLKSKRSVDLIADRTITPGERHYFFRNIDIVLLEGIFLFKPAYRDQFDLKVWIDCSFDTALRRAIARGQEGLPPIETRHAFETIYFPAQQLHFERDEPRAVADIVFDNDVC